MTKIAIIGSGLSGLTLAHFLQDLADISIFEKARGVGGRLSTRRAEPYTFDHGAQYFTAKTKPFQEFMEVLKEKGAVKEWAARFVSFNGSSMSQLKPSVYPRYVGLPGNNELVKTLNNGVTVHLSTRIVSLKYDTQWALVDENGLVHKGFDWVISTAPAPQAAELLPLTFKYLPHIKSIKMLPSFALMLGFSTKLSLDFEAAFVSNADISWIADNSSKPGRPDSSALVVHSSDEYSQTHVDDDPDEVTQHLIAETSRIIGKDLKHADYTSLHNWRYAKNTETPSSAPIFLDEANKLAACGDWVYGGRVEGAFTSAYHLARSLKKFL